MVDAPEKIWVDPNTWDASLNTEGVEYTRADVVLVMVAAAYEAAWRVIWPRPLNGPPRKPTANNGPEYRKVYQVQLLAWRDAQDIRSLTPADARAALERVRREARNEAIEATLAALQRHCKDEWVKNLRVQHVKRMIALMEDSDDD